MRGSAQVRKARRAVVQESAELPPGFLFPSFRSAAGGIRAQAPCAASPAGREAGAPCALPGSRRRQLLPQAQRGCSCCRRREPARSPGQDQRPGRSRSDTPNTLNTLDTLTRRGAQRALPGSRRRQLLPQAQRGCSCCRRRGDSLPIRARDLHPCTVRAAHRCEKARRAVVEESPELPPGYLFVYQQAGASPCWKPEAAAAPAGAARVQMLPEAGSEAGAGAIH